MVYSTIVYDIADNLIPVYTLTRTRTRPKHAYIRIIQLHIAGEAITVGILLLTAHVAGGNYPHTICSSKIFRLIYVSS